VCVCVCVCVCVRVCVLHDGSRKRCVRVDGTNTDGFSSSQNVIEKNGGKQVLTKLN